MNKQRIPALLDTADWGDFQPLIDGLKQWVFYPLLRETYDTLKEDALYKSAIHGRGHIHRVLLFAGILAWREGLEEADVRQLFCAACYHDVGRTFDGYDIYHGARSSLRLAELTGESGETLLELKAAVTAHARPDSQMESIVSSFHPQSLSHALELTRLLKDADNLDRVRLGDLKPKFLRHESAQELVEFSYHLFAMDQAAKITA